MVMADVRGTGPGSEGSNTGARRENWSRRIGEALEKDLFVLHAQRIVDVPRGRRCATSSSCEWSTGRG